MERQQHADKDSVARNLALEAELLHLLDAFAHEGIDVIVLKGIPLARRLFGQIGHRRILDNDLLVHRADVERAVSTLDRLGYRSVPYRGLAVDLPSSFEHAMSRTDDSGNTLWAEVHWHAFIRELFDVSDALLWQRSVPVDFKGRQIRVLDEAMTMLHLTSHFIQHGCLQPRILADLAAAWVERSAAFDPEDVLRLANETGMRDALSYAFNTCVKLGLLPQAPLGIPSLRAAILGVVVPTAFVNRGGRVLNYWTTPAAWACLAPTRLPGLILRSVAPPLPVMGAIYGKPPSLRLLPRYVTRLFRPLGRFANEYLTPKRRRTPRH